MALRRRGCVRAELLGLVSWSLRCVFLHNSHLLCANCRAGDGYLGEDLYDGDLVVSERGAGAPGHPILYPFPKDWFLNRYEISYKRKPLEYVRIDAQEDRSSSDMKKTAQAP